MSQPLRHDPYAALRIPNFRRFVAGLMAMTVATQIQAVVVVWQIYDLTHDPLSLGLLDVGHRERGDPVYLLQVLTPDHLLGRVSSVNAIFIGSSNEIGAFESGTAARLIGTVPSVVLGGLATLVVVAVTAVKVPQFRRLREIR